MKTLYESAAVAKLKHITERIKTFEDACKELGIEKIELGVTGLDSDQASIEAYSKLIIIAKALNEGWVPDWSNDNEYKYQPWFKEKPGFGLAYGGYGDWLTRTLVGSRLCYRTSELAEYAATQFADLYNDFLTIK